jgi:D-glycero-alpha-D-manno-heptose-7-phosphate kinase
MIITRTPYRVSMFGGGTDYPDWYRKHGGSVLGFAINKYSWISLRKLPPFFPHTHRIVWSKIENVKSFNDIEHPIVRHVLASEGIHCGVEIHHTGDLPARSGLGTSSAFTVGLLNAIRAFRGQHIDCEELANRSIYVERDLVGDNVGSQDQIWAAFGGFGKVDFNKDDTFSVNPLFISNDSIAELNDWMMLVFTGLSRSSSEMAGKQISNFKDRENQLHRMREMVDEGFSILTSHCSPRNIGNLLHESWKLKRSLADGVSTNEIDQIYDTAMSYGAIGGKLLGAGGGGFFLFVAPPQCHEKIRSRLRALVHVPFKIGAERSRVVVYEQEES